jgi:hypothetical protein
MVEPSNLPKGDEVDIGEQIALAIIMLVLVKRS